MTRLFMNCFGSILSKTFGTEFADIWTLSSVGSKIKGYLEQFFFVLPFMYLKRCFLTE